MRHAWLIAVILILTGCATQSVPETTFFPPFWHEWNPTPVTLLESVENYPVVRRAPEVAAEPSPPADQSDVAANVPAPPPPPVPQAPPAPAPPADNPAIEYVELGTTLKLAASADGTPPLQFQWRRDGQPIAGATQALLTIANVKASDAGVYVCSVSNAAGSQTSPPVKVVVRAGEKR